MSFNNVSSYACVKEMRPESTKKQKLYDWGKKIP